MNDEALMTNDEPISTTWMALAQTLTAFQGAGKKIRGAQMHGTNMEL
jgi:hypothetical protein